MKTHQINANVLTEELILTLRSVEIGDIVIMPEKGRFLVAPTKYNTKHIPCETCVFYDPAKAKSEDCKMRGACMAHKRADHKSVNFPRQLKA